MGSDGEKAVDAYYHLSLSGERGEFLLTREVIENTPTEEFRKAIDALIAESIGRGLELTKVPQVDGGVLIKWRPAVPITFRSR
jgi:hypothetical protein